ncbi:MAG: HEAT repeat domain-containing protein [Chloroflexi bacterium]|nr:HEAT repeat domain-containing protein [Chloroflexota bacterium]
MAGKKKIILDFEAALAHLRDESAEPSAAALGALTGASKTDARAFAQTWSELAVARRRRVAQMLVERAEENFELDFTPLFRQMFTDVDPHVRVAAIEGLWEDEDGALGKVFVAFLRHDPDPRVRAAAADALGRFVLLAEYGHISEHLGTTAADALLTTIRSEREERTVLCRAVEAFAYSSQPIVREVIRVAYVDEDAEMRASALVAMGHSADEHWSATLADELESDDARMRFSAAHAVGELEDQTAVPRLIELLNDTDREVQTAAITSLSQIGGKSAQNALARVAASDDEVLSNLAQEALEELNLNANSDLLLFDVDADDGADLLDDLEDADEDE